MSNLILHKSGIDALVALLPEQKRATELKWWISTNESIAEVQRWRSNDESLPTTHKASLAFPKVDRVGVHITVSVSDPVVVATIAYLQRTSEFYWRVYCTSNLEGVLYAASFISGSCNAHIKELLETLTGTRLPPNGEFSIESISTEGVVTIFVFDENHYTQIRAEHRASQAMA